MLGYKNNDQIAAEEHAARQALQPPKDDFSSAEYALARHVRNCWEAAKRHRTSTGLDHRLADCLRRRKGEYDPVKLAAITEFGGSDIYMQITGSKCRAAKAWLSDLFSPAGDKPWSLDPTPIPDLDPAIIQKMVREAMAVLAQSEMTQEQAMALLEKHKDRLLNEAKEEAKIRMERMSDVIEDRMAEGDFRQELDAFFDDFVTYPFAVMKGLEFTTRSTMKWTDVGGGRFQPKKENIVLPRVRRVSPWAFFPSPSVVGSLDGHYSIEHRVFTRKDLAGMAITGGHGYINQNIAKALTEYGQGGLREWMFGLKEREVLTGTSWVTDSETIDAIEFEGSMQGQRLLDAGVSPEVVGDPLSEHQVTVLIVGNYVLRAQMNPDPGGKSSYGLSQWQTVPGTYQGVALPESISDMQDQCNVAARSLANNMAIASGPMVWTDLAMLANGEDVTELVPWKIFQGDTSSQMGQGGSRKAIEFFQAQSNANELMSIYDRFSRYADNAAGLPSYAEGSDAGAGAAKTASGLSMLLNNVGKTIKSAARNIELNGLEPMITKFYNHEMLYNPDPEIKGDAVCKARGSDQLIQKEQQAIRQRELLATTGNPMDMEIIELDGRRKQLEQVFKASDTDSEGIVPSKEEFQERQQAKIEQQKAQLAAQQQGQPPQGGPNAEAAA